MLKVKLENRRRFAFSWCDYLFAILCWSKWKKNSKSQASLSFRNSLYKDGLKRFKQETNTIEIIKSIRQLKILIKILLSKNQIKLLELEDSNLLCKDFDAESKLEDKIVQNHNGIQVKSSRSSSTNQEKPIQEHEESEVEIRHKDLPKYLSQQTDDNFKHKIDKIVSQFGNQENDKQNKKILNLAYGLIEDYFVDEHTSGPYSRESDEYSDIPANGVIRRNTNSLWASKIPTSKVAGMKAKLDKS